jgi:RNA polymerase sigma factor (sigma-70 family)
VRTGESDRGRQLELSDGDAPRGLPYGSDLIWQTPGCCRSVVCPRELRGEMLAGAVVTQPRASRPTDRVPRDFRRASDVELLRSENADAFVELYDRYAARIFGWARARVGEDAAADLTAEVFARAWESRNRFRDNAAGSTGPWLFAIARNLMLDAFRRQRIASESRRRLGVPCESGLDERLEAVERSASVSRAALAAIGDLSEAEREILHLRVIEECPYNEIAKRLSCSPQVARVRVSRALRRLRQLAIGGESS